MTTPRLDEATAHREAAEQALAAVMRAIDSRLLSLRRRKAVTRKTAVTERLAEERAAA